MRIDELELATEALRTVSDCRGDGHLIGVANRDADDVMAAVGSTVDAALVDLLSALELSRPLIPAGTRSCVCNACHSAGRDVDHAIACLRTRIR